MCEKIYGSNNSQLQSDDVNKPTMLLAISAEEICQILYPLFVASKTPKLCANQKSESDSSNETKLEMPKLFHSFISTSIPSTTNVKVEDISSLEQRISHIVELISQG